MQASIGDDRLHGRPRWASFQSSSVSALQAQRTDPWSQSADPTNLSQRRSYKTLLTLPRRKTAIDARTTCHSGYDIRQRCRKRIEEIFGWIKSSAGLAKCHNRMDGAFVLALAAYN